MKRIAFALVFLTVQAFAAEPPRMLVEIYHIAPGQHTAFLEAIAKYDEANRIAGLPPRQHGKHSHRNCAPHTILQLHLIQSVERPLIGLVRLRDGRATTTQAVRRQVAPPPAARAKCKPLALIPKMKRKR